MAILAFMVLLSGCAALLEGDTLSYSPHVSAPKDDSPEELIEVSNYEELVVEMLEIIMQHADLGKMHSNSYDGDIDADIRRARDEIIHNHPVGAYAVAEITGQTQRYVSYLDIEISFDYKRTKMQVDSIVNVSTLRYLRTELLGAMSDYRDDMVFRTSLDISETDIAALIREEYYQNPRSIVMLPITAVEIFPESGEDRIFELSFSYLDRANIMQRYGTSLSVHVRRNTLAAIGETDAEILLSLLNNLVSFVSYDDGAAQAIGEYGAQNLTATAYGALVNGNAVGEGFAMAYKALCDELGFDCRVVLGYHNGIVHAWNIVSLYGDYYHIDVSMCAVDGVETAFLRSDASMMGQYSWNTGNTVRCEGSLTYREVLGIDDEDEDADDMEGDSEENPGQPGERPDNPPDINDGDATPPPEGDFGGESEDEEDTENEEDTEDTGDTAGL